MLCLNVLTTCLSARLQAINSGNLLVHEEKAARGNWLKDFQSDIDVRQPVTVIIGTSVTLQPTSHSKWVLAHC